MNFSTSLFCLPLKASSTSVFKDGGPISPKSPRGPRHCSIGGGVYIGFLLCLIAAYLAAIFKMDAIACEGEGELCYNYSKLEWGFSQDKADLALGAWNSKQRAAMSLSAGLHIFSSFLFAQFFIFGAYMVEEYYAGQQWSSSRWVAAQLPKVGRIFNILYCAAHSTIAAMVVSGRATSSGPPAVGVLIIAALVLLIASSLFLLGSFVTYLAVSCCFGRSRGTQPMGDEELINKL